MTELSEYDPFVPSTLDAMVRNTPGLGVAYEMANNALEASLGLDYWREQTMHLTGASDMEGSASGSDSGSSSDPEIQRAMRLSRDEYYGSRPATKTTERPSGLLTPSLSPPKSVGNADSRRTAQAQNKPTRPFEPSSVSAVSGLGFSKALQNGKDQKMSDSICYKKALPSSDKPTINLMGDVSASDSKSKKPTKKPTSTPLFQQPSFLDNTWNRLNRSIEEPTSDAVDGEM